MELEFLSDLYEARMTRNSGDTAKLTYNDCCERLYLTMLVLELLSKYPKYMPYARAYAKKTKDKPKKNKENQRNIKKNKRKTKKNKEKPKKNKKIVFPYVSLVFSVLSPAY